MALRAVPDHPKFYRYSSITEFPVGRDVEGRKLCRWCKSVIPKGRRTICSSECTEQILLRVNPDKYIRDRVYERDRGMCSMCGLDTVALRDAIIYVRNLFSPYKLNRWNDFLLFLRDIGHERRWHGHLGLWDADHIVPVIEGGGQCGLDNIRTLCIRCHKKVTAELAARRAAQRRETGHA
jgi:5-methylcytosine-specific restriction protein A